MKFYSNILLISIISLAVLCQIGDCSDNYDSDEFYDDESHEYYEPSGDFSWEPKSNLRVQAVELGKHCKKSDECKKNDLNSICNLKIHKCECSEPYVNLKGKCKKNVVPIGGICIHHAECSNSDSQSFCNFTMNKCQCNVGYVYESDRCQPKGVKIDGRCSSTLACRRNDQLSDCNPITRTCECMFGNVNEGGKCQRLEVKSPKQGCHSDNDCSSCAQCIDNKCLCKKQNLILKDNQWICINAVKYGDTCQMIDECELFDVSSHCDVKDKVCQCDEGYEYDGEKCTRRILAEDFHYHIVAIIEVFLISVIIILIFLSILWYFKKRRVTLLRYKKLINSSSIATLDASKV